MTAPTYNTTGASGATDAGSDWSYTAAAGSAAGLVVIVQILQDGATAGAVAVTGSSNIVDLAGSAGWTSIGSFAVGDPTAAYQHFYIGRRTSTSSPTISGTNSTSEDLYILAYAFNDVSTGTTLATVIENGTAGATANGVGTSATASDTAVTTLGPDRLALNFVAVNDDNTILLFTGMSGGTWAGTAAFKESSGTDGSVTCFAAAMASAGTIDGGTGSITDSDSWGVVGFALIGTTPSTPAALAGMRRRHQAVATAANW